LRKKNKPKNSSPVGGKTEAYILEQRLPTFSPYLGVKKLPVLPVDFPFNLDAQCEIQQF